MHETSDARITFTLNGRAESVVVGSHEDVVDLVGRFDLFGARESCGQGLCGCCTVLVDGLAVSGCLMPALLADGKAITTIEALDEDGRVTHVQEAFIEESAFQCGFCTPGFVMMTHSLLLENPDPSDDQIKDYLAGNLCRCAAYPEILKAVRSAAQRIAVKSSEATDLPSEGVRS